MDNVEVVKKEVERVRLRVDFVVVVVISKVYEDVIKEDEE